MKRFFVRKNDSFDHVPFHKHRMRFLRGWQSNPLFINKFFMLHLPYELFASEKNIFDGSKQLALISVLSLKVVLK